jgi:hypothetical protein
MLRGVDILGSTMRRTAAGAFALAALTEPGRAE